MSFPGPPIDPELVALLEPVESQEEFTLQSIIKRRKFVEPLCGIQQVHDDPDISYEEATTPGPGGEIILSILRSKTSTPEKNAPGIYLIHGGGMVLGTRLFLINNMFPTIKIGAVLVSVEYRVAPEHPAPAAVEDCYTGLKWMFENAITLGVDASKIIISGGSAGGGLAAGVALLNRDRKGPSLFAQVLVYPMLDDRCTSVSVKQFETLGNWTGKANVECWNHYLPGIRGTDKVSIYDAPSRAQDLSGLPQTFIEVGASEPFRDEDVAFATKLWEHGVQAELHVWPGGLHGYDVFAPNSKIGQSSKQTRLNWFKKILAAPTVPSIPAVL
ncbi:alpha/beta hydrolase fold-3 domain-containing protein [Mollisia scopiformis]|uniref:Alpha/beta hydrolase fold-3 domain-containing protein n=1 Tax=Mollisia scopiformis TaxID=149040 RepID=A0A194X8W8_MOLSC|nr:alpha/beta hydrolase fold-3 domain-containing protein [Mollisia scopiformis]KUJ16232.1 alpha/beta hydrolase fold-3 domain-containing protein [Mollisia scopiformis]